LQEISPKKKNNTPMKFFRRKLTPFLPGIAEKMTKMPQFQWTPRGIEKGGKRTIKMSFYFSSFV
jgi:hypothetical protein